MKERTTDHFEIKMALRSLACTSIRSPSTLHTNRERRELQELQKKFMDNVSVCIIYYQAFSFCLDLEF